MLAISYACLVVRFQALMVKGEFGNLCVVVAAWGALVCAVAGTNYLSHGAIHLVSDNSVDAAAAEPVVDAEPHLSVLLPKQDFYAEPKVLQPNAASEAVLPRLFLEYPDLKKDVEKKPDWPSRGVILPRARASAFENIVYGNYTAAGKLFDLAKRHPLKRFMCGDDNGVWQIKHDEALLAAIIELKKNPDARIENEHSSADFRRADLAEVVGNKIDMFTYLRLELFDLQKQNEKLPSDSLAVEIARIKALFGELSPSQRLAADAACDRQMQREPECTTATNAMLCGRYWSATGVQNRALEAFEFAQRFHDWDNGRVYGLYDLYKNNGQWFKAYDFALEGSKLRPYEQSTYQACLIDFYLRLEKYPRWRAKLFERSPALAAELNQSSWRAQAYKIGSEAVAEDLRQQTTERIIWRFGKGGTYLCAPSLSYLIEWCKVENLQDKLKPLLDLNLALAKKYGTTSDIVDAISLLRDNYNKMGDIALTAKCDAALYKAVTEDDRISDGAAGVLWLNDRSLNELANCCVDPMKKKAVLDVFAACRTQVVKKFGVNSLQQMMQIRNLAHFEIACGKNDQAVKLLQAAWTMALGGKAFPIEERRKVLVDYIIALKATNKQAEAASLAPLLLAISDVDSN